MTTASPCPKYHHFNPPWDDDNVKSVEIDTILVAISIDINEPVGILDEATEKNIEALLRRVQTLFGNVW
jgi:hypothetical protein